MRNASKRKLKGKSFCSMNKIYVSVSLRDLKNCSIQKTEIKRFVWIDLATQ